MSQEVRSELYFLIAKFIKQDFPEFGDKFIKGCEERGLFPSRVFFNKPSFDTLDKQLLSGIPNDQLLRLITLSCPRSQFPSLIFNEQKQMTTLNRSDMLSYNLGQPITPLHKILPAYRISGHFDSAFCIAVDNTSQILITGADDFVIKVWKIPELILIKSFLNCHTKEITEIVIHPQNHIFASSSYDGRLNIFSLFRGELISTLQLDVGIQSIRFSPCGRYLAIGCNEGIIKVFNVVDEKIELNFDFSIQKSAAWVSFSPGGNFLAISAEGGALVVVSIEHQQKISLVGHYKQPDFVYFSRTSPYLLISLATKERALRGWFASDGNLWGHKMNFSVRCPNNIKYKLVSFSVNCDDTRIVGVSLNWLYSWDMATRRQVCVVNHQIFTDHCTKIACHPKLPNIVFVGTESGRSSIWDIESGSLLATFTLGQEGGRVNDAIWSVDGSVVYAIDECGGITAFMCGKVTKFTNTEMFFRAENDPDASLNDTEIVDSQGNALMPQPKRFNLKDMKLRLKPPKIDNMIIEEEKNMMKVWEKKSKEASIGEQMRSRSQNQRNQREEEEEDEDENNDTDLDVTPQSLESNVLVVEQINRFDMVTPPVLAAHSDSESESQSYSTHDVSSEENSETPIREIQASRAMSTRNTRRTNPLEEEFFRRSSRPVRSYSPPSSSKSKTRTKRSPTKTKSQEYEESEVEEDVEEEKPKNRKKPKMKVVYMSEDENFEESYDENDEDDDDDFNSSSSSHDDNENDDDNKPPPFIGIQSRRAARIEKEQLIKEAQSKNKKSKDTKQKTSKKSNDEKTSKNTKSDTKHKSDIKQKSDTKHKSDMKHKSDKKHKSDNEYDESEEESKTDKRKKNQKVDKKRQEVDEKTMRTRSNPKKVKRFDENSDNDKKNSHATSPSRKVHRSVPTPKNKSEEKENENKIDLPLLFPFKSPSHEKVSNFWTSDNKIPGIFYPQKGSKVVFVTSAMKEFVRQNNYPFTPPYRINKKVSPFSKGIITKVSPYKSDGCSVTVKFDNQFECDIYVPVPFYPIYLIPEEVFDSKLGDQFKRGRKVKTIDDRQGTIDTRLRSDDGYNVIAININDKLYKCSTWDVVRLDHPALNVVDSLRLERANQRAGQKIEQHIGKIPRIEECQNDKRLQSNNLRPISLQLILLRCGNAFYKTASGLIDDIDELVKAANAIGVKGEAFRDIIADMKENTEAAFRGIE